MRSISFKRKFDKSTSLCHLKSLVHLSPCDKWTVLLLSAVKPNGREENGTPSKMKKIWQIAYLPAMLNCHGQWSFLVKQKFKLLNSILPKSNSKSLSPSKSLSVMSCFDSSFSSGWSKNFFYLYHWYDLTYAWVVYFSSRVVSRPDGGWVEVPMY